MSGDLTRETATADALSGLHALRPAPLLPPLGSGLSWEVHTHQQGTGRAWTNVQITAERGGRTSTLDARFHPGPDPQDGWDMHVAGLCRVFDCADPAWTSMADDVMAALARFVEGAGLTGPERLWRVPESIAVANAEGAPLGDGREPVVVERLSAHRVAVNGRAVALRSEPTGLGRVSAVFTVWLEREAAQARARARASASAGEAVAPVVGGASPRG